jgi:hypothetical protein
LVAVIQLKANAKVIRNPVGGFSVKNTPQRAFVCAATIKCGKKL